MSICLFRVKWNGEDRDKAVLLTLTCVLQASSRRIDGRCEHVASWAVSCILNILEILAQYNIYLCVYSTYIYLIFVAKKFDIPRNLCGSVPECSGAKVHCPNEMATRKTKLQGGVCSGYTQSKEKAAF